MNDIFRTYLLSTSICLFLTGLVFLFPWDHRYVYVLYSGIYFLLGSLIINKLTKNRQSIFIYVLLLSFAIISIGIAGILKFFPFSPLAFLNGQEFVGLAIISCLILTVLSVFPPIRNPKKALFPFATAIIFILFHGFPLQVPFPKPTGPYSVGTNAYHFVDSSRAEVLTHDVNDVRELMIQFSYPTPPKTDGKLFSYKSSQRYFCHSHPQASMLDIDQKYPLIIYSSGKGGSRFDNSIQFEDLASHGYVVAAIDHMHLHTTLLPNGQEILPYSTDFFESVSFDTSYVQQIELGVRIEDIQHTLEELRRLSQDSSSFLYDKLDFQRLGIFGWSIGGAASGAICSIDPRFKAGINLDGWDWMSLTDSSKFLGNFLYIHSDRNEVGWKELLVAGMRRSSFEKREAQQKFYEQSLFANTKAPGYKIVIPGSMHANFRDSGFMGFGQLGSMKAADISQLTRQYMLAFFDEYLKEKSGKFIKQLNENPDEVEVMLFQDY